MGSLILIIISAMFSIYSMVFKNFMPEILSPTFDYIDRDFPFK